MKYSRAGESLWQEWSGNDFLPNQSSAFVFYTEEHVDLENEIVLRALASCVQRDGIVDSLGQAFQLVERGLITHGYAGEVNGESEFTICDVYGMTTYGDDVGETIPITLVELYV